MARGGLEERALRHESHDLAPRGRHAARFRLQLHRVERAMQRRAIDVDEIHRDLRLTVDLEAKPLHVAEPARRSTHGLGDFLRDGHVGGVAKVDVVRDEKGTRADGDGARRRVNAARSEVGIAVGIRADLGTQTLELSASHVREVLAIGACGGALVQKDRDLELAADALTEGSRERDAVFHRAALERHEGHDVGGTHAGMLAAVRVEIDMLARRLDAGERRGDRAFHGHDEGDDRAVVRLVGGDIEDVHAVDGGDRIPDLCDDLWAAAF